MTPAELQSLTVIAGLIKSMSTWPIGAIVIILQLSPWILLLYITRSQDRRVGVQKQMYENNVQLVDNYETLVKNHAAVAKELIGIIHLNTQVQTSLVEKIDNNMFCPNMRKKGPQG